MLKQALTTAVCVVLFLSVHSFVNAQESEEKPDTFFLVKKKGLLRKLGKSISVTPPIEDPIKTVNPFLVHSGKVIRFIEILRLGFERSITDTNAIKNNVGVYIANALHKNTRAKVISNNLFFKEGDLVQPYLIADNERHLRDQVYIQDARIMIDPVAGCMDSVDVIVITKDVFSIGARGSINNTSKAKLQLREENLGGNGSRLAFGTLYDRSRDPKFGFDAEFLKRNIKGSFIDWSIGVQTYKTAFNSGREEETMFYTHFERPLVTPYIPWIGALNISYNRTKNAYVNDSLYKSDYRYTYYNFDGWFGYNFGSMKQLYRNSQTRVRKMFALRGLNQRFSRVPDITKTTFDYRYVNVTGALAAFSIFKQDFYRANFIYGFGRNEDVPEGYSISFVGGYVNKQDSIRNSARSRPYYGIEWQRNHFNSKGFYSAYTFRVGSYVYQKRFEDIDILFNVDHFTRLRKWRGRWLNRNFLSLGFTRQVRQVLNQPLILSSVFGLPYFQNGTITADVRSTARAESVFFNMRKFYGFRAAPFIFGDLCVITPTNLPFSKSDLYSAVGAGIRLRNENLVFGTIELRGFYFPRTVGSMSSFKIDINTNLRFKYNSSFARRPDFVVPN